MFQKAGGVIANAPGPASGRYLSFGEREEIAVGLAAGHSLSRIARGLGRARSTICREVQRNSSRRGGYRAGRAQSETQRRARRPKTANLAALPVLRARVEARLQECWSPEQIARTLAAEHPHDAEMRVSHETIYQSVYVQGRGALRRELAGCLRTGRALRKPATTSSGRGRLQGMVMISERPAEVEDRAVPGHWEGDLIIGKNGDSAIGTLVERTTRFVMLLHLPGDRTAQAVRDQMIATIRTLPDALKRSVTWDQGHEMAHHKEISMATDMAIYFCDPHSPCQRGTNENTNGLLRQYFPKGTDLSVHTREHLNNVADELNDRPRKTLNWRSPAQALRETLETADN
ncbi:IS30 family transposase [Streptomyces sp. JJ36]|nr:IS30 family transposase [Streptomyces sp. JJ36]